MLQIITCEAAREFDKEGNIIVGTYFGVQADNMSLTVLRGDADIVLRDGIEYLFLPKVGDVLVNANFTLPQYPGKKFDYKYLLHVVNPDELEAADKNLEAKEAARKALIHPEKFPEQVLNLVNKERAKVGIRPLFLSVELQNAAMIRAKELARLYSHTRPDGTIFTALLNKNQLAGENIAVESETPEEVMESWMNSPGHRQNILERRFKYLGVGYYYTPDGVGGYKHHWVQIFQG